MDSDSRSKELDQGARSNLNVTMPVGGQSSVAIKSCYNFNEPIACYNPRRQGPFDYVGPLSLSLHLSTRLVPAVSTGNSTNEEGS